MNASERERLILDYLAKNETATTKTLKEVTGVSIATVRRDLNTMSDRGLLIKNHGGAEAMEETASIGDYSALSDADPHIDKKDEIATRAAQLVKPGDTIFLGAGKTCSLLARYIKDIPNIRVVTTSINAVIELTVSDSASILLLGGDIYVGSNYIETLDEYTIQSLSKYYFDKVFITVNGIDFYFGYSINYRLQILLYEYLMQNCTDFFVMADSNKFDKRAFTQFTSLSEVKNVVTNTDTDPRYLDYYKKNDITVYT